jgi:hypothetical protein
MASLYLLNTGAKTIAALLFKQPTPTKPESKNFNLNKGKKEPFKAGSL